MANADFIKIIVEEGPFFGIEHNAACGSDGLKIHGQENEELVGFGRLCSSPTSATKPYNGMAAYKTKNGEKIQSKLFRNWLELDSDHLVIGFDTDQNNEGAGFILRWRFDDAGTTTAPVTTTAYPLEPGAVSIRECTRTFLIHWLGNSGGFRERFGRGLHGNYSL